MGGPSFAVVRAAVVVVGAGLALWQLPHDVRSLHAEIADGRAEGALERQLAPAREFRISDPNAFVHAAAVMPSNARYVVLLGVKAPGAAPGNLRWVPPFADYWLQPRERVPLAEDATWVLAYGAPLTGLPIAREAQIGPGIVVARLRK